MSESLTSELVRLEELDFHHGFRGSLSDWSIAFARWKHSEELKWCFTPPQRSLSREQGISIQQRAKILIQNGKGAMTDVSLVESQSEGAAFQLVANAIEGESFPSYCQRISASYTTGYLLLLLDMVSELQRWEQFPRLLSSVALEDFFVTLRASTELNLTLATPFGLIRNEMPISENQLACRWIEEVAICVAEAKGKWVRQRKRRRHRVAKPFRRLLARARKGKGRSLSEYLGEIKVILASEIRDLDGGGSESRVVGQGSERPRGQLSAILCDGVQESYPDRFSVEGDSAEFHPFSSFVLRSPKVGAPASEEQRALYLLPPERWFRRSFLEPVNRKMGDPLLREHFNHIRIRAIYCDDAYTALLGDPDFGIPLPALLQNRGGVLPEEVLVILAKLSRALQQFESAGHDIDIESPWQLELHSDGENGDPSWLNEWIAQDIRCWPAWNIKIRVEKPSESFFVDPTNLSWKISYERLLSKSFPALLVWMLEWKRLNEHAEKRAIRDVLISSDPKLGSLFSAAAEHFHPRHDGHRMKLLDFAAEALGISSPAK